MTVNELLKSCNGKNYMGVRIFAYSKSEETGIINYVNNTKITIFNLLEGNPYVWEEVLKYQGICHREVYFWSIEMDYYRLVLWIALKDE